MRQKIRITFTDSKVETAYVNDINDLDKTNVAKITDTDGKELFVNDARIAYINPKDLKMFLEARIGEGNVRIDLKGYTARGTAAQTTTKSYRATVVNTKTNKKLDVEVDVDTDGYGDNGNDDVGYTIVGKGGIARPCVNGKDFINTLAFFLGGKQ